MYMFTCNMHLLMLVRIPMHVHVHISPFLHVGKLTFSCSVHMSTLTGCSVDIFKFICFLSTKGTQGTKLYPKVPGAKNASTRYHSLVNDVLVPSIFVIARSTAAFPAFLINYG